MGQEIATCVIWSPVWIVNDDHNKMSKVTLKIGEKRLLEVNGSPVNFILLFFVIF